MPNTYLLHSLGKIKNKHYINPLNFVIEVALISSTMSI